MTPTVWLKSIVAHFPKYAAKDTYAPLHCRSISLISYICKGYLSILNKRIVTNREKLNIFTEKLNGFRKDRSCTDYIFSLTLIIRNRIASNLSTIICFIYMQKAFDWVDCELSINYYNITLMGICIIQLKLYIPNQYSQIS